MKNIKYLISMACLLFNTALSAQSWLWARTGNTTANANASSVIVSSHGTIYIKGGYGGILTMDTVSLNAGPISNGFIASSSSAGTFLKATKIIPVPGSHGSQGSFSMNSLNNDLDDNVYLTGQINDNIIFDTISTNSLFIGYLAKFNSNLNGLSVKYASDMVYSSAFDNEKSMYLAGTIDKSISHIDTFTLYNSNPQPLFNPKMFLAKLDSAGKCLWVKQGFGGNSSIFKVCIKNDNIYIHGYMDSCVNFDTVNHCGLSGFVMKTDKNGNVKWSSTYTHLNHGYFTSIDVDANSNCYVIGGFDSTMYLQNYTLTRAPNSLYNGFVAKYDSTGVILWLKQFSSDSLFHFDAMHTDDAGNTYALGYFSKTGVFLNDTIVAQTGRDMFVVRLNSSGDYLGMKILPTNSLAKSIAQDADGSAIVTGNINTGTTYFDNIPLTCTGQSNFFLAKLEAITGGTNTVRMMRLDDRLVIYPNPNQKLFTIEVPPSIAQSNSAFLDIFDNAGRAVQHGTVDISNGKVQMDIGTVPKGIYNVTLSTGKNKFTGRVVVE